ncbi:MAG: hypothetical protein CO073_04350 [Candidatus Komeilibacteria bacterium CG_4_9_14_0_8_um_filter_36_9]|uniref:Uncharacterized protein n=2 Tax=Candidatus Komeiliibacteriota TaxID=1817908 RepID=A0A2M8DQ39_9BACT|nr:MAG: hypothetical protein COY67_00235 [Candidatus Komeilibacteria bacterium CG_4_10_14_0_8_um_filter_37_78]PJC01096.1 MAG: hypothetical protein CO073_04350 [Candidatus Komeilibacteria bacterium CG_4_9_14_0_8_um_filter_36_9]
MLASEITSSGLNILIFLIVTIILVILVAVFIYFLKKYIHDHNVLPEDWRPIVLLLTLPKPNKGKDEITAQEVQNTIAMAENLFAALGGLKPQQGWKAWLYGRSDIFSCELVAKNGEIIFYVVTPEVNKQFVEHQIQATYPHINIEQVDDYNIFQPQGKVGAALLKFRRAYIFPIKTYRKQDSDPLNTITNTLSKLQDNEGAVIQLTMQSANKAWHAKGRKVASIMQQGKKLDDAVKAVGFGSKFSRMVDIVWQLMKTSDKNDAASATPHYQLSPLEQTMVQSLEEKTAKAGLDVNLRIIVSANDQHSVDNTLANITNAFSQFNMYEYGNAFVVYHPDNEKKQSRIVFDSIHRNFSSHGSLLLNTEELVSLWHLPSASNETPNIRWLQARKAAPPINLPDTGVILGTSEYRGISRVVRMKRADRSRHVYIIGQTGTGKSTIMKNMMIQDMAAGEGCCILDPHGDFAHDMLKNIPADRLDDVIYFNPVDTERPMALNMLEYENPEQKTFVVNELLSIFDKLYDLKQTGGPMFEQYMRNALGLVMEDPESGMTLMEVPKVLADVDFRKYKLSKCLNPTIKDFWEKEAEKAGGEAALANMVPYITSKLTPFIANDVMRPIIAQQKSSLNFRKIMDQKKILICNLSKGKLGDINASLLGMIIVGKILLASLSRADIEEENRQDYYLYLDEFQNFTTDSIAVILSEARKYKLNLIMAHQFLGQLTKGGNSSIRDAVFGNVGTTIAYRVGVDDAETLAKQFAPVFDQFDVVNIPRFTAYVRLMIDNQAPPAFNVVISKEPAGDPQVMAKVIELSRMKYGRLRSEIEQEIQARADFVNNSTVKKVEALS